MKTALPHSRRYAIVTESWQPQVTGATPTLGRLCDGLLDAGHQLQLIRPAHSDDALGTVGVADDADPADDRPPGDGVADV